MTLLINRFGTFLSPTQIRKKNCQFLAQIQAQNVVFSPSNLAIFSTFLRKSCLCCSLFVIGTNWIWLDIEPINGFERFSKDIKSRAAFANTERMINRLKSYGENNSVKVYKWKIKKMFFSFTIRIKDEIIRLFVNE